MNVRKRVALRTGLLTLALVAALTAPAGARAPSPAASVSPALAATRAAIDRQAWPQAESLATAGLATARTAADSADWIVALVFARWRGDRERTPGTSALAARALAIRQVDPGPDSLPLAAACEVHAYGLSADGRPGEADPYVERALALRARHAPRPDPDALRLLHLRGVLAMGRRDYVRAATLFREEIVAREAFSPRDPSEIARATMSLGSAELALSHRDEAIAAFQRALVLFDESPLSRDRDRLYALSTLAVTLGTADRLSEALAMAQYAVELSERSLGPAHAQTGYAHRSLSYAYSALGDYASAREEGLIAVRILTAALGREHDQAAQTRRMLAVNSAKAGDFETSLPIAEEVLRTLESQPQPDPGKLIPAMNSVAYSLYGLGRKDEAFQLLTRALALADQHLGPTHANTTFQMVSMAGACQDLGQLDRADSLLVIARAVTVQRDGPRHSSMVRILRALGISESSRRHWAHADSLLTEAVSIAREKRAGNPEELEPALLERARERADAGRGDEAIADALEAATLHREKARLLADGLSEREALRFSAASPSGAPLALSIAVDRPVSSATRRAVWDAFILGRSRVVDDMAERLHAGEHDPAADSLAEQFRSASAELSASLVRPLAADRADSLRRRVESLEVALGRASARWRRDRADARVGFDAVRAGLPAGTALVAYVRYPRGHSSDSRARWTPVFSYAAFVLPAGSNDPRVVPLGAAEQIDSLVARWNALAGAPAAGDEALRRLRSTGAVVRARMWDPIRPSLGDASLALVVPDGQLQLVNIATLPDGSGWMIEREPTLHALTAERDVARSEADRPGSGLLAVGAPEFDGAAAASEGLVAWRGQRPRCGHFEDVRFVALPETRGEADAIVALWREQHGAERGGASALLGRDASEARFKRDAPGHRVLHLATHGFFVEPECLAGDSLAMRGVALAAWAPPAALKPSPPKSGTPVAGPPPGNPLLLAGLALAGANRRADASAGTEDGVLTAQEIAAIDLRGAEWAVLSACRSGVGVPQDGEGVSGLRRAFRVAGAQTVISSLWPVTDESARAWMEMLYRHRLVDGQSTAEAVRTASRDRLRALRAAHASTAPVGWGAFFAAGDWR